MPKSSGSPWEWTNPESDLRGLYAVLPTADGCSWQSGAMDATAIKSKFNQMLSMIKEYHECFDGILFSGFVRMGQGSPLEMITTCEVRRVSNGECDVNCLA
jgi:hypothetical protein